MGIGGVGVLRNSSDNDRPTVGNNNIGQQAILSKFKRRSRCYIFSGYADHMAVHQTVDHIRHGGYRETDIPASRHDISETTLDARGNDGIAGINQYAASIIHIVVHAIRVDRGMTVE